MKNKEISNVSEIKITVNYNLFKINKLFNRDLYVNTKDFAGLVASIKNHGRVLMPILVDKNHFILDGQHRFMAAKELQKPLPYIVLKDSEKIMDIIKDLNSCSKNWNNNDYLKHNYQKPSYKFFKQVLDEYGMPFSTTYALLTGKNYDVAAKNNFKSGLLKLSFQQKQDFKTAIKKVDLLLHEVKKVSISNYRLLKKVKCAVPLRELALKDYVNWDSFINSLQKTDNLDFKVESNKSLRFTLESIYTGGLKC